MYFTKSLEKMTDAELKMAALSAESMYRQTSQVDFRRLADLARDEQERRLSQAENPYMEAQCKQKASS